LKILKNGKKFREKVIVNTIERKDVTKKLVENIMERKTLSKNSQDDSEKIEKNIKKE